MTYQESLATGRRTENTIAMYLCARGWLVLVIERENSDKGPRIYSAEGELVAPDLLVFNSSKVRWVEAKQKTRCTWYRTKRRWQTGIDLRYYEHYQKVAANSPIPFWLLFLHEDPLPGPQDLRAGCDEKCPTGLFGRKINELAKCVDHKSDKWGPHGMVYWNITELRLIATIEQVYATIAGKKPIIREATRRADFVRGA